MNTDAYISQIYPLSDFNRVWASGWVASQFVASDPTPSPTCLRRGHDWSEAKPSRLDHTGETMVRICCRCLKRGAYVFLTESGFS